MSHLRPGDIVSRRKGLVMHRGISLGDGRVLHNTPFRGEHICTESEFRAGRRLHVHRLDGELRGRVIRRAMDHAPRGYNVLTNNCEHTVTRHTAGAAHSPQLRSWINGSGLAAAAFALTRHPAVAVAAYAAGRRIGQRLGAKLAR